MTSKINILQEFDRGIPGLNLYQWDAAMSVARPLAEERVRHEQRSLGGKNAAKGEGGKIKRAIRADWPKLIDQGIPANKAVHKLAKKYERSASTVRKHVQDLR